VMKIPYVIFVFPGFFLAMGVVCLSWPQKIQDLAIRSSEQWPDWMLKYYPLAKWSKEWMRMPRYIWYLRAMGLVFIVAGCFFLLLLVRAPG